MSWSWSHSVEAYQNAKENLSKLSIKTLVVIAAEWIGYDSTVECPRCSLEEVVDPECKLCGGDGRVVHYSSSSSNLNEQRYKAELKRLRSEIKAGRIAKDTLVDSIWEKAGKLATCTNGGWGAWMCPFGCDCHMVSFSTFAERMAEAKKRKRDNEPLAKMIS